MSDSAQHNFAARIDSLGEAGDFVEQFCADRHIADGDMLRLKLVVEELFTHTATYGGDGAATVRIELSVSDETIALLYEDSAAPFDPIAHPEPASLDAPLELRPVGGLGIHLVVQMSHDIRYAREEPFNRLWLKLRRAG
jgi:anti-sigma regulatory factor (Ser/Thr protein kinase)